jgi:hypothetical protein
MGSTYWTVVTGHPSKGEFGFYACILNDYWALLWDLGAYNWSYILNRYN